MNVELLNKAKDLIVSQANKAGVSLQDDFESPDEFRKFVVGFCVRALMMHCDMSIDDAFDAVMGEGEFERLCDECWEASQP